MKIQIKTLVMPTTLTYILMRELLKEMEYMKNLKIRLKKIA